MSLERLESLRHEMKKCVRCSLCKLVPMPTIQDTRFTSACPPVNKSCETKRTRSGCGSRTWALFGIAQRVSQRS